MNFSHFSTYLDRISQTTSRNDITVILSECFSELMQSPKEIEAGCWLLLGRILPPYEGLEFQFAEKMMMKAVGRVTGKESDEVLALYKQKGDLAQTAFDLIVPVSANTQTSLSVLDVYTELTTLARLSGQGSQELKIEKVTAILNSVDALSALYIVRIILTKLRLGFSDMTILDALSWVKVGSKKDRSGIEDAYQVQHDIGKVARTYLLDGLEGLQNFDIELGIPLQPALCQRLKTATEMIEKMGKVYVEPKYDGTRVQMHIQPQGTHWTVRTFSRSLEESSAQFPELKEAITALGNHELILDCEAIGFDPVTGKLKAFQETIQRKRIHDVELFSTQIPLKFFVFDVLFVDGKSLLKSPLCKRKEILHTLLGDTAHSSFIESPFIITESADELRAFHGKQLSAGLEGAVIKQFDSIYQPGRKGWSWVKFKEEEGSEAKLSDTIDAVVMGYWYGKGKRHQFGIGAFLIGVLGKDDRILTLSKVGTGLGDEQWRELKQRVESLVNSEQPTRYDVVKALIPDVWVDPGIVVEVAGDELTKSPAHSAGLALRFPRLVKFRDDKKVQDITTQAELHSL